MVHWLLDKVLKVWLFLTLWFFVQKGWWVPLGRRRSRNVLFVWLNEHGTILFWDVPQSLNLTFRLWSRLLQFLWWNVKLLWSDWCMLLHWDWSDRDRLGREILQATSIIIIIYFRESPWVLATECFFNEFRQILTLWLKRVFLWMCNF